MISLRLSSYIRKNRWKYKDRRKENMVKGNDLRGDVATPADTIYSLIKRKNSEYTGPAGNSAEIEQAISFLRSQHEETYKQIIAPVVSYFLTALVAENDKKPQQRHLGAFNAQNPPDVSISDYLARIVKYTPCSAECYLLSIIFIDRVVQNHQIRVNSYNVHRLLLIATVMAAKLLDDTTVNNKYYSHVGGIPIKELNSLECKLLGLMNYDLNVSTFSFELYRYELELQLIRQMRGETEENVFNMEEMLKWESSEDNKSPTSNTPEGMAYLRAKRLRRSRSFNNPSSVDPKRTFRRKNRSISFTILDLLSPATTAT